MTNEEAHRIYRAATPEERERLEKYRQQIEGELPDILERADRREAAKQELTISGQLRRAIADSDLRYHEIAAQSGISLVALDEFMTGERALSTHEVDKLAAALGLELQSVR